MNHKLTRWTAVAAFAIAGAIPLVTLRADDAASKTEVAEVDQLKTQAFAALRVGNFDQGNDLLGQAAKLSPDPTLLKMHTWTSQFEDQLRGVADERHKQYDKDVADVKKLLDAGYEDYAMDMADSAQLYSDDKKAFHDLPWVQSLIADGIKHANDYETAEDWVACHARVFRFGSGGTSIQGMERKAEGGHPPGPAAVDLRTGCAQIDAGQRMVRSAIRSRRFSVRTTQPTGKLEALAPIPPHSPPPSPTEAVAEGNENFKDRTGTMHHSRDRHAEAAGQFAVHVCQLRILPRCELPRFDDRRAGLTGIECGHQHAWGWKKTFPSNLAGCQRSGREFQKFINDWMRQSVIAKPPLRIMKRI